MIQDRGDNAPAIEGLLAEHADLERQLSDPDLHADAANARQVGRRFAQVAPVVTTYRKLESARGDLEAARELGADDESFAAEVPELAARVAELDTQLTDMLAPRDPHDADDIVLEVKSGEGGEESALFAADLARMYIRYAERHGWNVTVLDETVSDLGGYKEATLSIGSKGDSADGVWSRLKFEGGVHRGTSGLEPRLALAGDLDALHPEDRAIQVDVFAARQLRMKARTDLEQRGVPSRALKELLQVNPLHKLHHHEFGVALPDCAH